LNEKILTTVVLLLRFFDTVGDRRPRVVEPMAVAKTYPADWKRPDLDLTELAILRWKKKWAIARIAEHLSWSYDSTKMHLRRLQAGDRYFRALEADMQKLVRKSSQYYTRGK
jgi:hypothetical protein